MSPALAHQPLPAFHHDAVHLNRCIAAIERGWLGARAHQPHRQGRRQHEQHERHTPPRPGMEDKVVVAHGMVKVERVGLAAWGAGSPP